MEAAPEEAQPAAEHPEHEQPRTPLPRRRPWTAKVAERLRLGPRNRVSPGLLELPDCDFFHVGPRRTLRVLRPRLAGRRFYEAVMANSRPESLNDNFYSRWARRPHPSGTCRCSFRASRLSGTDEEQAEITREIARIRSSICEAEASGRGLEDLERTLDLGRLEAKSPAQPTLEERLEPLDDLVKRRIVRDLDRYVSGLLDEILDDTIRALAKSERPFKGEDHGQPSAAPNFDISFAFHGSEEAGEAEARVREAKGYVNRGFVGSPADPDALDFHLRGDALLENIDCVDSGINSVETVELQPEQEHNLEQSLMDIIDAKLGGASIGKSLEDLGMEIDATDESKPTTSEDGAGSRASEEAPEAAKSTAGEPLAATPAPTELGSSARSLDEAAELEPAFAGLRLEFKRGSSASSAPQEAGRSVGGRVNRTVSAIGQRIARRLRRAGPPRKPPTVAPGPATAAASRTASARGALELEDYRRRFPVPEAARPHSRLQFRPADGPAEEVTLRHRKPTLVFLHGFGSSAEVFEPQLSYFAALGYPCVAPDLLGHGLSSAPNRRADYRFAKLLRDLETLLQHYAIRPGHKCVLVAHNYGCSFATALASKYAGSVHQLVLISGGGPTPLAPPLKEGAGHCCLRASLAPLLVCGMHRAVIYSARGRQHPYCGGEAAEDQWPSHMRHVLKGMSWPDGDYVFHRRISTPALLVHGLRDNKVSLVQECQMERTMIKAFLEAIPAAGHMPMTDCPEQLNHMIHCFIDLWKNKKW